MLSAYVFIVPSLVLPFHLLYQPPLLKTTIRQLIKCSTQFRHCQADLLPGLGCPSVNQLQKKAPSGTMNSCSLDFAKTLVTGRQAPSPKKKPSPEKARGYSLSAYCLWHCAFSSANSAKNSKKSMPWRSTGSSLRAYFMTHARSKSLCGEKVPFFTPNDRVSSAPSASDMEGFNRRENFP